MLKSKVAAGPKPKHWRKKTLLHQEANVKLKRKVQVKTKVKGGLDRLLKGGCNMGYRRFKLFGARKKVEEVVGLEPGSVCSKEEGGEGHPSSRKLIKGDGYEEKEQEEMRIGIKMEEMKSFARVTVKLMVASQPHPQGASAGYHGSSTPSLVFCQPCSHIHQVLS